MLNIFKTNRTNFLLDFVLGLFVFYQSLKEVNTLAILSTRKQHKKIKKYNNEIQYSIYIKLLILNKAVRMTH